MHFSKTALYFTLVQKFKLPLFYYKKSEETFTRCMFHFYSWNVEWSFTYIMIFMIKKWERIIYLCAKEEYEIKGLLFEKYFFFFLFNA